MSLTPADQSIDVLSNEFALKVKTLLSNFPRPMFDSSVSLLETVDEASRAFAECIIEFDTKVGEITDRSGNHILDVLTSAVMLTHQIACETAHDLNEMLPDDVRDSARLWRFMQENTGPIDHHLITPGVLAAAASLQSKILWEAATSVQSASLGVASIFVRMSCDALESAVSQMELSRLDASNI